MYRFDYSRLKDKSKVYYDLDDDYAHLLEPVLSMYESDGLPDTFNLNFFLNYLLTEGWACLGPGKDGEIAALHFKPAGTPDSNGIGKEGIITSDNGLSIQVKDWKTDTKYIACHLNNIYTPDLNLSKTAYFLSQIDVSFLSLIKAARYNKIFSCPDSKVEAAIKQAFKNADNGEPLTVVSENIALSLKGTDGTIKAIDITDPDIATRLQYLLKAQDDVISEFYNRYGLSSFGSGKMAQLTKEEATDGENRAEVIPDSRLKILRAWIEKVNVAYGYNASIQYSKPWRDEHSTKEEDNNEEMEHTEDTESESEGFSSGGDNDKPAGEDVDKE